MISQCVKCGRFIHGTVADPIITAKSLGWKNYHEECSKAEWARLGKLGELHMGTKKASPPKADKKVQYYVQCILIVDGKEESRWHDISDTMKEAEAYCKIQMAPSEFSKEWAMAKRPEDPDEENTPTKDVSCNMTSRKYVNCIISMILTNGKQTVIEEMIHPLAPELSVDQMDNAESSVEM